MHRTAFAAAITVSAIAFTQIASAADLPREAPFYMPVFSWTGCYIGGNIGYGFHGEITGVPDLAGASFGPVAGNTNGFLGGGQVGCNYQFASNWVIGTEVDGEATGISGDVTQSFSFVGPAGRTTVTGTAHAQTNWIASANGRLGWTWDRVMLYAKGGVAWAGVNERIDTNVTRPGWTVGGGLEWAFWNNWSAKVEYNFYDFDTRNLTFPGTFAGVPEAVRSIDIKETISTVKFGVNYRF